jgi:hypothetical protein
LRGVLDAAGDGDAAWDEFAVALRRVGIGGWRGRELVVALGNAGDLWWNWRVMTDGRGRRVGRKGRAGAARMGRDPAQERETVFRPRAGTRERGVGLPPLGRCPFKIWIPRT